jgi:hypothetical protein
MLTKIIIPLLLFFCLQSNEQTLYVSGRNKGSVNGTLTAIPGKYVLVNMSDTVQPKKHWHSYSLNKDLDENVKDSAAKYYWIAVHYLDSANEQHGLGNELHFRYYYRKAMEARNKSFKYVEKQ